MKLIKATNYADLPKSAIDDNKCTNANAWSAQKIKEMFTLYTMWGGRNLVDVLGVSSASDAIVWLNENCQNPTAWKTAGIMVGDYVEVSSTTFTTANQKIAIAQCDFDGYYYSDYKPCIWMTFVDCIAKKAHHTSNTNAGGYPASDIRTWLNSTVYNALKTLGFNVKNTKLLEDTANGRTCAWQDEKVFLPTESQVYGHGCFGNCVDDGHSANSGQPRQLDYYRLRPNNSKKYYNGENTWWWLQNPGWLYSSDRSATFCDVDGYGIAHVLNATYVGGVCPAFVI